MSRDFDELVGVDVEPAERARLARAHELLLAAGPPPELPPHLEHPTAPPTEALPFVPRRRRPATIGMLAAAVALAALVGGYVWGRDAGGLGTDFTVAMHGTIAAPTALASLQVAPIDEAGNWPMRLRVAHLRELPKGQRYQLWLTKKGRPAALCGVFRVAGDETTVYLNAPFRFRNYDGWIVRRGSDGPVVLTT